MDRVRIFIDFWNFQINWNEYIGNDKIDWKILPRELINQSEKVLKEVGINNSLQLLETCVYTSISKDKPNMLKQKQWLSNILDRFPGYRVFIRERSAQTKPIHCINCNYEFNTCPQCQTKITRSVEKGVDTQIVTDLMSQAWEKTYDIGLLLSSDSDFIPAVERLQEKGIKIINGCWKRSGNQLAKTCWASFHLEDISERIIRKSPNQ